MDRLLEALQATGYPFAAYSWDGTPDGTFGVVLKTGENVLHIGGQPVERADEVDVELYTKDAAHTVPDTVETVLEGMHGVAWELVAVQYEEDTGYIHYSWEVEVL